MSGAHGVLYVSVFVMENGGVVDVGGEGVLYG